MFITFVQIEIRIQVSEQRKERLEKEAVNNLNMSFPFTFVRKEFRHPMHRTRTSRRHETSDLQIRARAPFDHWLAAAACAYG